MNTPDDLANRVPAHGAVAKSVGPAPHDAPAPAQDGGPQASLNKLLGEAYAALRMGRLEAGCKALSQALLIAQPADATEHLLRMDRERLAFLCANALEFGIEATYARSLVERAQLQAPSPEWMRWPYAVRIFTFGRPSLLVGGQPLRVSGKAQLRPLEMLFYLVASGARDVPISRMEAALWPPEDGQEATRGAFDMALSRLRRLLSAPDALILHGGRLSLNGRLSWADLWAFERLLTTVEHAGEPVVRASALIHVLLHYQGDFLEGVEHAWAAVARERIRSKLIRAIREVAQALQQASQWQPAVQLLDRARDRFPLEEEIWRGLIRCRLEQGEVAQAVHLYERCRDLFAGALGVLPSAATTALVEGRGFKRGG